VSDVSDLVAHWQTGEFAAKNVQSTAELPEEARGKEQDEEEEKKTKYERRPQKTGILVPSSSTSSSMSLRNIFLLELLLQCKTSPRTSTAARTRFLIPIQ
jgi:hypothetical protein